MWAMGLLFIMAFFFCTGTLGFRTNTRHPSLMIKELIKGHRFTYQVGTFASQLKKLFHKEGAFFL